MRARQECRDAGAESDARRAGTIDRGLRESKRSDGTTSEEEAKTKAESMKGVGERIDDERAEESSWALR
eukprot:3470355-Pleurochrysis_carterae.AAC.1